MFTILLSVFFLAVPAHAYLSVVGSSQQDLALQGPCDEVRAEIPYLQQLSQRLGVEEHCESIPIRQVPGDGIQDGPICSMSFQGCLPEHMLERVGTTLPQTGPNCYGTALHSTFNAPHLRFASELEFRAILESPHCREVDTPQPGDFGAFRIPEHGQDPSTQIYLHGFVYVSPHLVFEKGGYDEPGEIFHFQLAQWANSRHIWEADPLCRQHGTPETCYNRISYHRCDLTEFHRAMSPPLSRSLFQLGEAVEAALDLPRQSADLSPSLVDIRAQLLAVRGVAQSSSAALSSADQRILTEQLASIEDWIDYLEGESSFDEVD